MARIVQFLKWMRRRDGGVVNTCMLLCPMLAQRGHEVVLLTCEDDDVPDEREAGELDDGLVARPQAEAPRKKSGYRKLRIESASQLPELEAALAALREQVRTEGSAPPLCVRVPLADFVATLRGRNALDSERDTPTQSLPALSMQAARVLLRGADVLHLHGIWAPSHAALARLAHREGTRFVVSPHGMLDAWSMAQGGLKKRLFLRFVANWQLCNASCVHFENEEELLQGRQYCEAPVVAGPPPPLDPRAFEPLPAPSIARERFAPLQEEGLKVLFLGRLNPKKGPDKLIEAAFAWKKARELDPGTPKIVTMFAGLGHPPEYETQLRNQVSVLGLAAHVHFLGLVTGEAKWSLLRAVDLVVLPTSQENFGIALVEAMLCGTPVLTTKQVDTWREFERGGGALILDGGGTLVRDLTSKVLELARKPEALREHGSVGQAWARSTYAPDEMGAAYERVLLS
jgi:glycosyltransferase involved in cell wall biosynthesis